MSEEDQRQCDRVCEYLAAVEAMQSLEKANGEPPKESKIAADECVALIHGILYQSSLLATFQHNDATCGLVESHISGARTQSTQSHHSAGCPHAEHTVEPVADLGGRMACDSLWSKNLCASCPSQSHQSACCPHAKQVVQQVADSSGRANCHVSSSERDCKPRAGSCARLGRLCSSAMRIGRLATGAEVASCSSCFCTRSASSNRVFGSPNIGCSRCSGCRLSTSFFRGSGDSGSFIGGDSFSGRTTGGGEGDRGCRMSIGDVDCCFACLSVGEWYWRYNSVGAKVTCAGSISRHNSSVLRSAALIPVARWLRHDATVTASASRGMHAC